MSQHEHDCNCGNPECNCQHDFATVTLTLDNDEVVECAVLTIYQAGDNEYIVLLPIVPEDDMEEESDVYIYRYTEDENGEPSLENIQDDEEYDLAADAFDEWLDTQELEEE